MLREEIDSLNNKVFSKLETLLRPSSSVFADSISPQVIDISINAGDSSNHFVTYRNDTDEPVTYEILVETYDPLSESYIDGESLLIPREEEITINPNEAVSYTHLMLPTIA